jgi:hypothetical protein
MRRTAALLIALATVAAGLVLFGGVARGDIGDTLGGDDDAAPVSGVLDFKDVTVANSVTQCPHAGQPSDHQPQPLDQGSKDKVEQVSNGGDDIRVNQDYSCFPQDETSIFVNPTNQRNIVGGANDYRLGTGSSGFYASSDNGQHWYDGILPFPTTSAASTTAGEPRTTRRSRSTATTTRAASSSPARSTAASRGADRACRSAAPPGRASATRTRSVAATATRASPATASSTTRPTTTRWRTAAYRSTTRST